MARRWAMRQTPFRSASRAASRPTSSYLRARRSTTSRLAAWFGLTAEFDLAESRIGVAVRAGAPKPDISTVDALRRTLLGASSIAYSASASGVYISTELYKRLGIEAEVMPKSRRILSERAAAVVARGEAEIGFQQISEIIGIPGAELVGPLPAEVQQVTVFSAGVLTIARQPEAAAELIRFLASPDAAETVASTGLDPLAHR